ncbi:MAG: sugar kinase [Pseudonocardiales bacterium]|nr:MAG: sugar kinase [Pseudonocardiales bacterium]
MPPVSSGLLLAIDIGGTKTALALASSAPCTRDVFLTRRRFRTPDSAAATLAALLPAARELIGDRELAGIGVSFGGQVRTDEAPRFRSLVISGWEALDVTAQFAAAFGDVPTLVANDGEAAARGEYVSLPTEAAGADLAYITVSTGVGGAFLLNGRPHRGRHGLAAEVGHIPLRSEGRCPCGGTGHLEAFASGPAIAAAAVSRLTASPEVGSQLRAVVGDAGTLTARDVDDAARRGDVFAAGILGEAGSLVGHAAALISLLLDPDVIVIGGGVSQAGDAFWQPLHAAARFEALHDTAILPSRLGPDSALRGAVELARDAARTTDRGDR